MSTRPSEPKFDPREPIRGYIVREMIGRGGFGEVWRAEAPGGLSKAIKIVHGGINFSRAERELRSLQRIKDVRHPLILSIERIEVISGTLVIVTELADCSLRDVFQKYRDKGEAGIPREKLLDLLRDAADALDYIYEEHSLQHLDIKPENLLIVGNRLKIGDFGLIKNIYERGASLVNGLTPTYAPPELFEGKPTRQSDQYSLAIVYQHMLTGELPFDGATPAQLAREHLAGVPRLTLLPKSERPIIARALAKSPADRYESCRALLKYLDRAPPELTDSDLDVLCGDSADDLRTRAVAIPGQPPQPATGDAASSVNIPGGAGLIDPLLGAIEASLSTTRPSSDTTSRRSEAIVGTGFVPTVFIGIGGTGGLILQELRSRLEDSLGPLSEIPALQLVLIDTDGKALNNLMRDHDVCRSMDVAALPLRRPEDYHFRESKLSKWLHRRWIYNMPRSLSTEGYRPLGRLALVDHGARIKTSIRSAIARAASAENAEKSAEKTGLPFRHGHVRIVLAASVSGATGGGMLLDLAYAARSELKKRSLPDEDVLACLLHAAPGSPSERDKATANAYALLSELGHYSSPGHFYPGENALETPQFHGDNRTFRTTYVVSLGHDVSTERWRTAAVEMAEYLYLTSATPGKLVVDAARHVDEARVDAGPTSVLVRSLCVQRLERAYSDDVAVCITQACRDVVTLWQTGHVSTPAPKRRSHADLTGVINEPVNPAKVREASAAECAAEWLRECGLEPDGMQQAARRLLEQLWDCDEATYLQRLLQRVCDEGQERRLKRTAIIENATRVVDRLLGDDPVADDSESLHDALRKGLAVFAEQLSASLGAQVRALVDRSDAGVDTARFTTLALSEQLKDLRSELERRKRAAATAASAAQQALLNGPPPAPSAGFRLFRRRKPAAPEELLTAQLATFAEHRLAETHLSELQMFLDAIHGQLSTLADHLLQLSRELACLTAEFQPPPPSQENAAGEGPETIAFVERIRAALQQQRVDIAQVIYDALQNSTLAGDQKLQRFLGGRSELQGTLRGPLLAAARYAVADQIRQTTVAWIEESARAAVDGQLTGCGRLVEEFLAERRARTRAPLQPVLVLAPDSVDQRVLNAAFTGCKDVRLVPARTCGLTVFAEVGARRLEDVAEEVVERQELYRQLAEKLHTREDVDWSPLPPPQSPTRDSGSKSVRVPIAPQK